jgi:hypothetical protein
VRELAAATVLGGLLAGLCTVGGWLTGGDPMLVIELAAAVLVSAWAARLAFDLWRQRQTIRLLSVAAAPATLAGVHYRVVLGLGPRAFVSGWLRPQIFVGDELLATLDRAELAGVLFHEHHHRRTRAPLRAAAIGAWLSVLGRLSVVESLVRGRLTDLERAADDYALSRGASPAALASALLKVAPASVPASASYAASADERIASLLRNSQGVSGSARSLPIEWLPPVAVLITLAVCHVLASAGAA